MVPGFSHAGFEKDYEEMALARSLSHPFSLAFAWTWAAWLSQLRREL